MFSPNGVTYSMYHCGFDVVAMQFAKADEQMIFDIFSIKKVFEFAFEQKMEYRYDRFVRDISESKKQLFPDQKRLTEIIESIEFRERAQRISFYPRWIINDDIFEVMSWVFGTTLFVSNLKKWRIFSQLKVILPS